MTDDRQPKDMIGLRNHQGRSSLSLSDNDHPTTWLRRRRVDVEARNKGGHLTVKPTAAGLDGYFSMGQVVGGTGGIHVMGDDDARGTFTDRGLFVTDTGFVYNAGFIVSSFDGFGITTAAERLGYVENNQGIGCPLFRYTVYRTYNGTKYAPMYTFVFTRATFDIGIENLNGATSLLPARYGNSRMSVGFAGVAMDTNKQFRPFLIRDYYNSASLLFTPYKEDQYAWENSIHRLAPTILMTKLLYMRSQYPLKYNNVTIPNRIDNSACPGYEFRFSHDNGDTWTNATSTEFFHEFDETVLPLPGTGVPPETEEGSQDTRANEAFNLCVNYLVIQSAPIAATKALCYGLVPYIVEYIPESNGYKVGGKVKLGIIDTAAGTIFSTLTLYENEDVEKAWYYMSSQTFAPIKGGVLMTRNATMGMLPWYDPPQPGFTPDGVGIVWQPPLDTAGYQCGGGLALGPNEVGMTSYHADRGYVLRSTRDRGATWQQRAVVTNKGVVPDETLQRPSLTQFPAVMQIRSGNLGSNPFQGVPWVSDSSIPAPVL